MAFLDCKRNFKFLNELSKNERQHLISIFENLYPNSEFDLSGIYYSENGFIIGAVMAYYLPQSNFVFLNKLYLSPQLKSKKYGREMISLLYKESLHKFSNFMGIVTIVQCHFNKKSINSVQKYKMNAMINAGGFIVYEKIKDASGFYHIVVLLNKDTLDVELIKEKILSTFGV